MSAHAAVKSRRRWVRLLGLVAIPLSFAIAGGTAWAYWIAGSTAGSNGAASATSVNAGSTPTGSATGAAVTVSWSASTLASGQAVTGYLVKRYEATTLVAQTILTACTGTVTATTCVESAVPQGAWKYSITPVFATNWRGAESSKSATVFVDSGAPTNALSLSNVTGGASLSATTVYYRGAALGSFTITNAVTDAVSGPASSQTAALTGTTTGWTHTPSTVSSPTGGPYVSNAFSWAAATTSGPGEVVTGRDLGNNSVTTSLTFVNDSTTPTAGTVTYADGLTGGTTVSVSFTTGTDATSGIGSRLLQRATAPVSGSTCGAYGAFATVTGGTNPISPVVDTVTIGSCYKYQYVVTDNVGNSTTASNANVARAEYGAYWAFDAGSGTTATDSTGMGNTATLQAAAGWTTGRTGNALNLTGAATSYAQTPLPVIDSSKNYSVAAWVKPNSLTGFQTIASMDGTNISPFYLQLDAGRLRFTVSNADNTASGGPQVLGPLAVIGQWYHVVGVYNQTAGTIELYVNGISQGTAAYSSGWQAAGATTIGRGKWAGGPVDFLNGAIDEVRFYDRVLTPAEVVTLRGAFGAYWALNSASGTTATDSSGNAHTGTLQATAGWTTGKIGSNAVSLTGAATSYVDINTPVINTAQSYTAAAWVKFNSVAGYQSVVGIDGNVVSPFYLQLDGTTGTFRFAQWGTDSTAGPVAGIQGVTPVVGTWYHIAGVYNSTANTVQLYVNGVSQGSTTATTAWTAYGHTSIGRTLYNGAQVDRVNGAVDEARLYDRALTQSEITVLAGSYSTTVSGTTGLISYWRLGEGTGTSMVDAVATTPNNGTYVNAPTLGAAGVNGNDANTAVTFDGVNDYATAPRELSGNFSIEFWVKSTQNFSNDFGQPHCTYWWQGAGLVDAEVGGTANDFGVSMCSGKIIAGTGNPDTSVVSSGTYNNGAWHHVVFTRTQATGLLTLYVDGASIGTATGNTNALTAATTINFGRSTAAVSYFAGTMDEIAFYNTALSGATVLAHYSAAG